MGQSPVQIIKYNWNLKKCYSSKKFHEYEGLFFIFILFYYYFFFLEKGSSMLEYNIYST